MNRFLYFCAAFAALATPFASAQQTSHFRSTSLNIGIYLINAEVAATEAQREKGLMYREKMGANEGMLFLFDAATQSKVCMWMKDTLLPLSVAFIDAQGRIVNIEDMAPQTTTSHCGNGTISYALEMNQGWFNNKHIKPGNVIDGLPRQQ